MRHCGIYKEIFIVDTKAKTGKGDNFWPLRVTKVARKSKSIELIYLNGSHNI